MDYLSSNGFDQVLEQWADADPNIQAYGYGEFYNQNGVPRSEQLYPGMWVNPVSTSIDFNVITRTYQIMIYDLVYFNDDGDTNQNKVISDTEEYALRLVRFLRGGDNDVFDVVDNPTLSPFTDKFLDDVSGIILDITIEFNAVSSDCLDPDYTFTILKNSI